MCNCDKISMIVHLQYILQYYDRAANTQIILILLYIYSKASIDELDDNLMTPLMVATKNDHKGVCKHPTQRINFFFHFPL